MKRSRLSIEKINVVIPYYKRKETVLKTIKSLLNAGIKEEQILIVDDNSNDNLHDEITPAFNQIKYTKNDRNRGAAFSRNVGYSQCNNDYILFIDADVYFEKKHFFNMLENYSEYDIVFPTILYEDGSVMSPNTDWEKKYCMCSALFLINKKAVEKMDEFFDENYFIYNEDSDFFLRCKAFGLTFKYVAESIFLHPKRNILSETSYYLTTKNVLYLSAKLWGIVKHRMPFIAYLLGYTFMNFMMAVLNRHIKFSPFIVEKTKYSNNYFANLRLVFLFFSALIWNFYNIATIFRKRTALKTALNR